MSTDAKREMRERIGLLADKADNYLSAASLPVSPALHVEGLTAGMRELRDELRAIHESMEAHDDD